jgi:hypothetical protein
MAEYREKFVINATTYGIEENPSRRAMDGKPSKQFYLWVSGCGFEECDTMEEARAGVHRHAVMRLKQELARTEKRLASLTETLSGLGDDPFNLGTFKAS